VDFAYAIHTSVGNRCRGAKANGVIVPLTQALQSGQVVEILTAKEGGPSRDWLNPRSGYVTTARARNRIRQWFKKLNYEQHVQDGRAGLDREITRLSLPKPDLDEMAGRFHFNSADDLLAAIGQGEVSAIQVANAQLGEAKPDANALAEEEIPERIRKRRIKHEHGTAGQVTVRGVGNLLTQLARCCKPVPYDEIVGYITRGHGVTVHRRDCRLVTKMDLPNQARLVEVAWSGAQDEARFQVDIQILAGDRKGLLRDISSVFANAEIDVLGVNTQSDRRHERANMRFTAEVNDMQQLSTVIDKLAQIPDVLDVRRHT
jgi:GTP pyrophosphokinase